VLATAEEGAVVVGIVVGVGWMCVEADGVDWRRVNEWTKNGTDQCRQRESLGH
jgi:hypothetical protein